LKLQEEHCPSENGDDDQDDNEPDVEEVDGQLLFPCPAENCIKIYQYEENLNRHLRHGNHIWRLERKSLRDYALDEYQRQVNRLKLFSSNIPLIEGAIRDMENQERAGRRNNLPIGWALQAQREHKRFSTAQRNYLKEKFDEGKKTNRKHTPQAIAESMKRDFDDPNDWLTWQQIASFWQSLAKKYKQKKITEDFRWGDDTPLEEDDESHDVEEIADEPVVNAIDLHIWEAIMAVVENGRFQDP